MPALQLEEDVQAKNLVIKHTDRVRNAMVGNRNKSLRNASRFIGHLTAANRIDRYSAEQALFDAAMAVGEEKEKSWDTIKRGLDFGEQEPMYRPARDEVLEYVYEGEQGQPLFRVLKDADKRFRQQRFENGEWISKLADTQRVLYRLPRVLEGIAKGETIWLVEGEKDVGTLESRGLYATSVSGGAGGWREEYAQVLAGAAVTIIPDFDIPGLEYAMRAHDSLVHAGCTVTLYLPSEEGQDVTEHIETGNTFKDLQECSRELLDMHHAALKTRQQGGILSHSELMLMDIPPQQWVVDDIVAPGVTLLFSVPKGRKSFLCLDLAISVSTGRPLFDKYSVKQGSVLYLALEDSTLRLRSRSEKILGGAIPGPLYLFPINSGPWGNLDEGGADRIIEWCKATKDPRLVIIDVFEKVRGRRRGDSVYGTDYEAIRPLGEVAAETGVAVVVVHHTRKGDYNPDDPMESASGSNGLRGSVDNLIFLRKKGDTGSLVLEGRDLNPAEIELDWDQPNLRWRLSNRAPDEIELLAIRNIIKQFKVRTVREIVTRELKLGREGNKVLDRLIERGELVEDAITGQIYQPSDPVSGTPMQWGL